MHAVQQSAKAGRAISDGPRRWQEISPTAYQRGKKELAKLQQKQKKQAAAGRTRDAKRTARLIAASWDVRLYLAIEECRKHNRKAQARRNVMQPAQAPVSSEFCNGLQQSEIEAFDRLAQNHCEELRRGEIVIEDDIVLVCNSAPACGAMKRKNATDAIALANRLGPSNAPLAKAPALNGRNDRYTVFPVAKGKGFRPMHAFGMFERARQQLLLNSYGGMLETNPASYSGKGKGGHHAAIRNVHEIMSDPKVRCVATLDLKSAYPSISRQWLKSNLPMPRSYITSTCLLEDKNEYEGSLMADGTGTARTRTSLKGIGHGLSGSSYLYAFLLHLTSLAGLPQGAATSTAMANHVIAIILKGVELPAGIHLVNVADDFAVLGASFADVDAAVETLREAFTSHPAGQFVMHRSNTRTLAAGFEFLGTKFSRRKGAVGCEPDADCKRRGELRILKSAQLIAEGKAGSAHLQSAIVATVGSFGTWKAKNNWVWRILRNLAARSSDFRNDIASILAVQRAAAVKELISFCSGNARTPIGP